MPADLSLTQTRVGRVMPAVSWSTRISADVRWHIHHLVSRGTDLPHKVTAFMGKE